MFTKASLIALFAAVVAAQTPGFNPITRPLNEIVPACAPFTITWTKTSSNKVSLVLLKGPSTNVVPIGDIVKGIDNSGSYEWTPEASLEATTDATGYGLKIVDDVTGDFQYSTQFGISKDACKDEPSGTPSGYPTYTSTQIPSYTAPPSYTPSASSTVNSSSTTIYVPTGYPHSTGAPVYNSSIVLPTKSMTVPSTLLPSATSGSPSSGTTPPPESTGAASALKAGFGLAGAVAGLVFML